MLSNMSNWKENSGLQDAAKHISICVISVLCKGGHKESQLAAKKKQDDSYVIAFEVGATKICPISFYNGRNYMLRKISDQKENIGLQELETPGLQIWRKKK